MKRGRAIIFLAVFLLAPVLSHCMATPDEGVVRLYGMCFSPYMDGQNPNWNSPVTEKQIQNRLTIITDHTQWIRTFGCDDNLKPTGRIAHTLGLKTAIGAWIGDDPIENEKQISNLITIAKAGDVDIAVVGNERILYYENKWSTRPDETELISIIARVKQEIPSINVTTAEPWHIWQDHPNLINAVDVLFVNIYPFHENQPLGNAIQFTEEKYNLVHNLAGSKQVVISEMGWPSEGNSLGNSVPSMENAIYYFHNATEWAEYNNIHIFILRRSMNSGNPSITREITIRNGHTSHIGGYGTLMELKSSPCCQLRMTLVSIKRASGISIPAGTADGMAVSSTGFMYLGQQAAYR